MPFFMFNTKNTFYTIRVVALIFIMVPHILSSQERGLLKYNQEATFEAYNLIYPHQQSNVYLLNNCGEIIHVWEDDPIYAPGNTAYLTPEGHLIKTKRKKNVSQDALWVGGGGGICEIRDWDNTLLWSYEINDSTRRLHHDILPMPNGHLLMIMWTLRTKKMMADKGRDTTLFVDDAWFDAIIEVDPSTSEIVWQWDTWDHVVQDRYPSKPHFGDVSVQAGKIDINYPAQNAMKSWFHINSVDYNEDLDQILISVPTFSEIWIIDHSTSTVEAQGSTGGLSGKGGEILYRWGNPKAYKSGVETDQKLFYQHGAHWIDNHVTPANPYYGKIAVFNNRIGSDYSAGTICTPPWDMYLWSYIREENQDFGPIDYDRVISHPEPTLCYSPILSNMQVLPNGNFSILSGNQGYVFEVNAAQQLVWEYKLPMRLGVPISRDQDIAAGESQMFRWDKYPIDYPAFGDKDLSPIGYIETDPDEDQCKKLVQTKDIHYKNDIIIYTMYNRQISFYTPMKAEAMVFNILGNVVDHKTIDQGYHSIDVDHLPSGTYILKFSNGQYYTFVIVQ